MTPASAGAPYQVPPEPSRWSSILLALGVHGVLLFFLWSGIRWQSSAPVAVEAEVWDLTTRQAAPAPVARPEPEDTPPPAPAPQAATPPAPKAPDIALEREKLRKEKALAEQKLREQEKARLAEEKKQAEKKEQAEEKARRDKLAREKKLAEEKRLKARADELKRITQALAGTGTAARSTAPKSDSGYIASLTAKIKSNISYAGPRSAAGNPTAIYRITQLPTGEIIGFKQLQSSGVPAYDRAVEQAIQASSPLPKKKDGSVERTIEPIFKLKEE
jgi:colicin import membrane protein